MPLPPREEGEGVRQCTAKMPAKQVLRPELGLLQFRVRVAVWVSVGVRVRAKARVMVACSYINRGVRSNRVMITFKRPLGSHYFTTYSKQVIATQRIICKPIDKA